MKIGLDVVDINNDFFLNLGRKPPDLVEIDRVKQPTTMSCNAARDKNETIVAVFRYRSNERERRALIY